MFNQDQQTTKILLYAIITVYIFSGEKFMIKLIAYAKFDFSTWISLNRQKARDCFYLILDISSLDGNFLLVLFSLHKTKASKYESVDDLTWARKFMIQIDYKHFNKSSYICLWVQWRKHANKLMAAVKSTLPHKKIQTCKEQRMLSPCFGHFVSGRPFPFNLLRAGRWFSFLIFNMTILHNTFISHSFCLILRFLDCILLAAMFLRPWNLFHCFWWFSRYWSWLWIAHFLQLSWRETKNTQIVLFNYRKGTCK